VAVYGGSPTRQLAQPVRRLCEVTWLWLAKTLYGS